MAGSAPQAIPDAIRIEDEIWQEAFATRIPSRGRHPMTGRERTVPVLDDQLATADPVAMTAELFDPPQPTPAAAGVPARRTVKIQGRGAERHLPWPGEFQRRRPPRALHERAGFRPDRVAMWAVFLGLLLVLVAAISAHG